MDPPLPAAAMVELEGKKKKKKVVAEEPFEKTRKKKKQKLYSPNESDHTEKKNKMNMKGKRGGGGEEEEVISDDRFAAAQSDPRFQRMPRRQSKVPIDERFSKMLTDERFGAFSGAPVDKRGRRRKKGNNVMLNYYIHDKKPIVDDVTESEEESKDEEIEKESGSGLESKDSEEDEFGAAENGSESSTSVSDEDDDEASVNSDIVRYLMANHEDTPTIDNETHRLAVVNLDWDHIKAVDLYVVMSSCLPKGGQIISVSVYPSEFGLKCMENEAIHGPTGLFVESDDHSEDESAIDNEKLRTYELNRLRYYYGVVVCDSSATANHLYKTLDGTELLKTSNVFDLRFIPDTMEFKHLPRDAAAEAPSNYKEPDFQTCALQHSNVKLTWEEDEPERKKTLRRKFNPNQLDELKEYLASTDDDDDDDDDYDDDEGDEKKIDEDKKRIGREKLRALLQAGDGSDAEDSNDKDMEITFNTGLEDLSKRILEKKDKRAETVWEAVLRKKKEKKAARKNRSKNSSDDESSDYDVKESRNPDEPDDFFADETGETEDEDKEINARDLSKTKKVKGKKKEKEQSPGLVKEEEASRAELELLFAEDQGADHGPKGYNLKPKKVKLKKSKREFVDEDKLPKFDIENDPRFSARFTSPLYALDPTDPQYKRSAAYARQQLQKQKMGGSGKVEAILEPPDKANTLAPSEDGAKEKYEFSFTKRSLKQKVALLKEMN